MHNPFRESDGCYRFQMSLDPDTFLRALPGAVDHDPFALEEGPDGVRVLTGRSPACPWRIRLAPLPPRRLGALTLDRLEVQLDLAGHSAEDAAAFAARFLRHFQRAGG
jgi:hypothetical protein